MLELDCLGLNLAVPRVILRESISLSVLLTFPLYKTWLVMYLSQGVTVNINYNTLRKVLKTVSGLLWAVEGVYRLSTQG